MSSIKATTTCILQETYDGDILLEAWSGGKKISVYFNKNPRYDDGMECFAMKTEDGGKDIEEYGIESFKELRNLLSFFLEKDNQD